MKYWGFYTSDELKAETQRIAIELNESDAEYIRKAVEQRNAQYPQSDKVKQMDAIGKLVDKGFISQEELKEAVKPLLPDKKPTIPELKEQVKKMERPKMVEYLGKGGK